MNSLTLKTKLSKELSKTSTGMTISLCSPFTAEIPKSVGRSFRLNFIKSEITKRNYRTRLQFFSLIIFLILFFIPNADSYVVSVV